MTSAHFLRQLDYAQWCHSRLLPALQPVYATDSYTQTTLSHIALAQQVWAARLAHMPLAPMDIFVPLPWHEATTLLHSTTHSLIQMLQQQPDTWPQEPLPHQNMKGESYTVPVHDILTHLLNHGTHHRAQLLSQLKRLGHQPPVLDYIAYVWGK